MVNVKGYVRSGRALFWQLPNGKYMRVRVGPRMQAYLNSLANKDVKLKGLIQE
jgi:hypothetical protein